MPRVPRGGCGTVTPVVTATAQVAARQINSARTITSIAGTLQTVNFQKALGDTVLDPTDGAYFDYPDNTPRIHVYQRGVYLVWGEAEWNVDPSATLGCVVRMVNGAGVDAIAVRSIESGIFAKSPEVAGTSFVWNARQGSCDPRIYVFNQTGANRTLSSLSLSVARICDVDSSPWTFVVPP